MFFRGAEFVGNVGTGSGGAILNHAELDFTGGSDPDNTTTFTLNFEDNDCGEQEVSSLGGDGSVLHRPWITFREVCATGDFIFAFFCFSWFLSACMHLHILFARPLFFGMPHTASCVRSRRALLGIEDRAAEAIEGVRSGGKEVDAEIIHPLA